MDLQTPLPEDLINEILLRLPLKSLARFKCVSKHWEDVISHHRFTKTRTLLYLREKDDVGRSWYCYDVYESFTGNIKPQYFPSNQLRLEGTYNGLICFSNDITGDACVWNPLLNQWRECNFQSRFYNRYAYFGLGFDTVNDDYKVVRIGVNRDYSLVIEICQLKNAETRVKVLPSDEVPFNLNKYLTSITVNGSSHWLAFHHKNNCFQIVRFDMDREIFHEIPFSDDMPNMDCGYYTEDNVEMRAYFGRNIDDQQFSLGVYKGSLCVFVITLGDVVDAWSMNYKNHDHSDVVWTRICVVALNRKINTVCGFTSDDKIVLASHYNGYFFYDPWKKQYIVPPRNRHLQMHQALAYVESLVPVQPQ